MNDKPLTIGETAAYLGVTPGSLRRWERERLIALAKRTAGGQRRYDRRTLRAPFVRASQIAHANAAKKTICYARVSSSGQRDDLARQEERLRSFCAARGWCFEVINDLGSGLNYKKRGLQRLLNLLVQGEIERLVLADRGALRRQRFVRCVLLDLQAQRHAHVGDIEGCATGSARVGVDLQRNPGSLQVGANP